MLSRLLILFALWCAFSDTASAQQPVPAPMPTAKAAAAPCATAVKVSVTHKRVGLVGRIAAHRAAKHVVKCAIPGVSLAR